MATKLCTSCDGDGTWPTFSAAEVTCPMCAGRGRTPIATPDLLFMLADAEEQLTAGEIGWDAAIAAGSRARAFRLLAAQAIEARRAETGTGSVHESAVPQECAPTPSSESHS